MQELAELFGTVGSSVFRWAAVLFFLVNGAAIAAFAASRSRALVNRWTPRIVAANLALIGLGVGIPAVTFCLKTVVSAVATTQATEIRIANE